MSDLETVLAGLTKPSTAAIQAAEASLFNCIAESGGMRAASLLAKAVVDCQTDDAVVACLGVLDRATKSKTAQEGFVDEFKRAVESMLVPMFRRMAPKGDATSSPLQKQALAALKGWKAASVFDVSVISQLSDILKKKDVPPATATAAVSGADGATTADTTASTSTINITQPTVADVEEQSRVLSDLSTGLTRLSFARKDHFVSRIDAFRKSKGMARMRRDDPETLDFLKKLAAEVSSEAQRVAAVKGEGGLKGEWAVADGESKSAPIAKMLDRMKHSNEGEVVATAGAAMMDPSKKVVAQYNSVPAVSALLCNHFSKKSIASRGSEIPTHERSALARHPWTAAARSPFVLSNKGGSMRHRMLWTQDTIDWVQTRNFSERPCVATIADDTFGDGTSSATEFGVKRDRDGGSL